MEPDATRTVSPGASVRTARLVISIFQISSTESIFKSKVTGGCAGKVIADRLAGTPSSRRSQHRLLRLSPNHQRQHGCDDAGCACDHEGLQVIALRRAHEAGEEGGAGRAQLMAGDDPAEDQRRVL